MRWRYGAPGVACFSVLVLVAEGQAAGALQGADERPLFLWVEPETKTRLLAAAAEAQPPQDIAQLFAKWVDLRWEVLQEVRRSRRGELDGVGEDEKKVDEERRSATTAALIYEALDETLRQRVVLPGVLANPQLAKVGGAARRLVLTWTSGETEFVNLAVNMALSIKRNVPALAPHFCVIAVDAAAEVALTAAGVCTLRHASEGGMPLQLERWNFKKRLLNTGIVAGFETLVVDADAVFLGNPFETALRFDADLEVGTDHFFVDRDLWQPYARVEENLNTGFLFGDGIDGARGARLFCFISRFVEVFADTDWLGLPRDFFDQRAFNKFVLAHLADAEGVVEMKHGNRTTKLPVGWAPEALAVRGILGRASRLTPCSGVNDLPVAIRVLDPVEVAHGMNFFWRSAHLARPGQRPPSFVHANGVDDKTYFMRDRGIWYLDDWDHRFSTEGSGLREPGPHMPLFLRYEHPVALPFRLDFEVLISALEVAKFVKRRLILPRTMNCENSPAFEAFQLPMRNCTIDHFASAKILFHYHNESLVEASIVDHPRFLQLTAALLASPARATAEALRRDSAAAERPAVLAVTGDIVAVAAALRQISGTDVADTPFQCKYAYWPGRQMACRDESFLKVFGEQRRCEPMPQQESCGVKGFSCCEVFHGWAEKLEFFTGQSWNLPCNCGLDDFCAEFTSTADYPELTTNHRCCHLRHQDPPLLHCFNIGSFPPSNPPMDFNSYSADILWAAAEGLASPQEVFGACARWTEAASVSMGLSTAPHDIGRDCTWTVAAFLLSRESYDQLSAFLDFMLRSVRRPLWRKGLVTLTMSDGTMDSSSFNVYKVHHDASQLEFLIQEGPKRGFSGGTTRNATFRWMREVLLTNYIALLDGANRGDPPELLYPAFTALDGVYNRPLFLVPPLGQQLPQHPIKAAALDAARRLEDGLVQHTYIAGVVDDFLDDEVWRALQWSLQASTMWFGSPAKREHVLLQTSLLDGLHDPLLLRIASSLRAALPQFIASPLRDVVARKYTAARENPGTSAHAMDAEVVACLFVAPGFDAAERGASGGGLRVLAAEAPSAWSEAEAFEWSAGGEEPAPHAERWSRAQAAAAEVVEPRPNRLVLWRGSQLAAGLASSGWPQLYQDARVEVYFLFGSQRRFMAYRPVG